MVWNVVALSVHDLFIKLAFNTIEEHTIECWSSLSTLIKIIYLAPYLLLGVHFIVVASTILLGEKIKRLHIKYKNWLRIIVTSYSFQSFETGTLSIK